MPILLKVGTTRKDAKDKKVAQINTCLLTRSHEVR